MADHPYTEINDRNFEAEITKHKGVSVVDFWAPWCGPCQILGPIIEEIATEMKGQIKVGKMNVDNNPETSEKFQVVSIPTVKIFKDGQPVDESIGVAPKATIVSKIKAQL